MFIAGTWYTWCTKYSFAINFQALAVGFVFQELLFNPPPLCLAPSCSHSLRFGRFLGEDPEDKVGLLVRLKGGGHDDVFPRRQPQPRADFPQVDEELRASAGGVREEKVPLEVDPRLAHHLGRKKTTASSVNSHLVRGWIFFIRINNWNKGIPTNIPHAAPVEDKETKTEQRLSHGTRHNGRT